MAEVSFILQLQKYLFKYDICNFLTYAPTHTETQTGFSQKIEVLFNFYLLEIGNVVKCKNFQNKIINMSTLMK